MKSLKFIVRIASFVLVLFAVAVSTHAQQCPGYNPIMYQDPNPGNTSAYNPPSPCAGKSIYSTASFSQTNSTTDHCGSFETGGELTTSSIVTGNGVASCTPVVVYCYPSFELEVTVATNQQDYNRFYNRAYDYTYSSSGCVRTPLFRQDFWQCAWYSCPPPQTGGLPPGCTCCNPCTAKQLEGKGGFVVQASQGGKLKLVQSQQCCVESPILIDVSGHGFVLTSVANGVTFDLAGTGSPIQIAWTAASANNAFLSLPGADGLVHNGKQLFGNFSPQPSSPTPNGFAALAVYDQPANGGNGDGIIDSRDAVFSSLRLWIDANHDGISQPNELFTLPSLGVNSISLNYKADLRTDQYGNLFRYRAQVNPGDPASVGRMAYDVFFSTLTNPGSSVLTAAKCPVPGTAKEELLPTDKK